MLRWSFVKRLAPAAVAVFASTFIYYGCVENSVGGKKEGPDVAGKSVGEILDCGHLALKNSEIDSALSYYEAAYQKDKNSAEAIAYSSLAKLASVSVDPKVANLLKNRMGFTEYPNKLNALLNGDWLTAYPEYGTVWGYYDETTDSYVRYFDQDDVDYGWYDGVNEPGYYRDVCDIDDDGYRVCTYELVKAGDPDYERYVEEDYYDKAIGEWVTWRDEWYVESDWWPEITKVGYYTYENEFVTSEPHYRDTFLPALAAPEWLKGNGGVYNGSLVYNAPTVETWGYLMLANLVDKNTAGLNNLIDELIAAVFGEQFEEIGRRVDRLKNSNAKIPLNREFLEATGMERLIDEFDYIGWAELNAAVSFMTAVKASLEWVASYDLNTNLNFLKYAWSDEDAFYARLRAVDAKDLPFNNNFLNARPGKMEASKASFIKAIEGLKASYAAILSDKKYPTAVKDAYPAFRDGADQLANAIKNGGVFYIPEDDPTKTGEWPASGNGIDMGKLFTPGYFSLQNIFETDADGRPVFYADGVELTADNYADMIYYAGRAGIKLNTGRFVDVLVTVEPIDDYDEPLLNFQDKYAKLLYEKLYGLPLTQPAAKKRPAKRPELPKQLAKAHAGK